MSDFRVIVYWGGYEAVTNETPLQVAERIEKETGEWLKEHGYHPTVAHLHIEAIHLQNKVLSVEVMNELLMGKVL